MEEGRKLYEGKWFRVISNSDGNDLIVEGPYTEITRIKISGMVTPVYGQKNGSSKKVKEFSLRIRDAVRSLINSQQGHRSGHVLLTDVVLPTKSVRMIFCDAKISFGDNLVSISKVLLDNFAAYPWKSCQRISNEQWLSLYSTYLSEIKKNGNRLIIR